MENNLVLKTSATIKAPIAKVWDALTNPEQIKKYFFGTHAVSDWKVGGKLNFVGEWKGKQYEDKGTILELEKEKKLKYKYWSALSGEEDIPENYHNVTYELESKEEGKTILALTQDGIETEEERVHSEKNWKSVFESLKDLLEEVNV
jgi:uncharacterized protein YndB with AHSA1/START domain